MSTASQLRKAREAMAAAQASFDDATAESRATAVAVEAAHKAVIARAPDAATLLQNRRADHEAAVIRAAAAEQSLGVARQALAKAENADKREQLAVAIRDANRAAVFDRLRPTLRALAQLRKWEVHETVQPGVYSITKTAFRMVEERPSFELTAAEHTAALKVFVRDEKKRAKAMRTIAAALSKQAAAIADAQQLAADLGQDTRVGNDETAPITWPHVFALVALEQAPAPLTRQWLGCWFKHFGIYQNSLRDMFEAGSDTLAIARAAVTGEPEPRPARHHTNWPADGSAPMPHPDADFGDPRHPGSQRSALRGRGGYRTRTLF